MNVWEPEINTYRWAAVTATGWDQARLDAAVIAHHHMFGNGPGVLQNLQLSGDAIAAVLATAAHRNDARKYQTAAGANPNTAPELATELWQHAQLHGDMALAGAVLTHPHLADDAVQWYERGYVAALSNPGIDPDWLHDHRDDDPWTVLNNPAVTAATAHAVRAEHSDNVLVLRATTPWLERDHPALTDALETADPNLRAWVYRHPDLDDAWLRDAVAAEMAKVGPYSATMNVLRTRLEVAAPADAGDEPARLVATGAAGKGPRQYTVRVELLEMAEASTPAQRDAAAALLHGGFNGSVRELYDVAASIVA